MLKSILSLLLVTLSLMVADAIPDKIKQQNMNVVKAAAKGLSEKLPQKVDKFTRLVKIKAEGETLIYTYELNVSGKSDDVLAKEGKERMKAPVTRGICISSSRFLESGIDIIYTYISTRSQNTLFSFKVDKESCK